MGRRRLTGVRKWRFSLSKSRMEGFTVSLSSLLLFGTLTLVVDVSAAAILCL